MSLSLKKSLEQKLTPFIYNRIYSINKGILRVLILIIYSFEIAFVKDLYDDYIFALSLADNNYYKVFHLFFIDYQNFNFLATTKSEYIVGYLHYLFSGLILYYFIYWTAIRLLLWIYDGFKKD